jgi:eukaryotic-like serine/threonine-protein kinase
MGEDPAGQGGVLPESGSGVIDEVCTRFEAAWCEGRQPRIEDFLPSVAPDQDPATLHRLLVQLVGIDLERRWRMAAETAERQPTGGEAAAAAPETGLLPPRPRLADYVARYPRLGPLEQLPIDLIVDEYYARCRFGDRPTHAEYLEVFGQQHPDLEERFRVIDEEAASARSSPPDLGADGGLLPGATVRYFGDYELLERLGKGGMGVVYKARQVSLKRLVALKMILAGQLADEQDIARFHVEAEAAANLDHPGIVQIFEIGQHQGQHYFSMGYVDGESLDARLKVSPLPPREAVQLMEQVARAVAYAHAQGVIHRDLKPANILVDKNNRPHVTDFGLAKQVQGDSSLTATGAVLGTPSYMSPEQASGRLDQITERSDVYSLGATLYALLVGRPPFQAATSLETLLQVREQEPVPLRQLNPKLPRDLETICVKCLEKDPEQRYDSAKHLGDELLRFLKNEPILARPVGKVEQLRRWCRRNPVVAGLSATAVLLLITVAVVASAGYIRTSRALAGESIARQEAEEKTREVEQENARAENNLYVARINLARQKWILGDVDGSERTLDACSLPLRAWEWRYLKRLCHLDARTLRNYSNDVRSVAFSPDGTHLAAEGDSGVVRIWDFINGRVTLTLHGGGECVTFSPDGKRIACGGRDNISGLLDNTVKIWDTARGQKVLTLRGHSGWVQYVTFSPDGKRIASGGSDGTVKVWDAANGQELCTFRGHSDVVNSVAFSPDGTGIASGSMDGTAKIWNVASGRVMRTLYGHSSTVTGVAFSPDGKRLASASGDSTIRIWDCLSGQEVYTLRGHMRLVSGVEFSPFGNWLASASWDKTVKIWNLDTGRELYTFRGHSDIVKGVTFSRGGVWVASCGGKTVKLWDFFRWNPEVSTLYGHSSDVLCLAFSPDGKRLASASRDQTVKLWDPATNGQELCTFRGHSDVVNSVAFSPDGKCIASGSWDKTVKLWNAATGQETRTLCSHSRVRCVVFSPDGKRLAAGGDDSLMKIWDTASGRELRTICAHSGLVYCLAFSPDGKQIASGSSDHTVKIWNVASGRLLRTLFGHSDYVECVTFSPDGKRLASGSGDSRIKVWDSLNGREVLTIDDATDGFFCSVAFSPDGTRLVSGRSETVKIWDVASGQELLALTGPPCPFASAAPVNSVIFSPDGRRLASGTCGRAVNIWDAPVAVSGDSIDDK